MSDKLLEWVLVPRVPTEAMLNAMGYDTAFNTYEEMCQEWADVLAAAPQREVVVDEALQATDGLGSLYSIEYVGPHTVQLTPVDVANPLPQRNGCACDKCGVDYIGDLLVPDSIWSQVCGFYRLLCPTCLLDMIVGKGIWTAATATNVDEALEAKLREARGLVEKWKRWGNPERSTLYKGDAATWTACAYSLAAILGDNDA